MKSQVEQARNRATYELPSVEDFIILRRRTIGGHIAEGASMLKFDSLHVAMKLMTAQRWWSTPWIYKSQSMSGTTRSFKRCRWR